MARRSPIRAGLALAFVLVISIAHADDKCRTGCRGAPHTFKYAEGTTYKYNFDSKIDITLSSAEGQKTTTEVKAQVLLTQQPQCNQVLRLQNVQVIGSDGKKHTQIPDIEKAIRLNFHDGHLEDSICITPGDTQNSLNIKRAVASLFQANLHGGHETDVFGLCPTDVTQHKEGNILVLQKTRHLNKCAYRESIKQDFLSTAFNLNSEIKSSPILNADYQAKLKIKNGILDQAVVSENYLYVPFSVGSNGAKAQVETTLTLTGTSKDNPQVKVSQPRSIIFEDPHPVNSPNSNVNSILAAVKQTAKTVGVTVSENTAKEFVNLIKILRVSNKDDLLAVYNQVRAGVGFSDKVAAKKIFLDALLRAGNGDTVEVAIELLKNKELSPVEQKLVYLGLSLVRHTTEASLNSAASLLNIPNLPREAYLGIGTLIGRHCRQHSCKNIDAVNKLTQQLVQKLGDGKAANRQDENDIIFVLKALGNTHHLNDAILSKITAIAQDKKTPNRMRVAALETYLADPCKDKLRDSALGILKDIQQDSEIRIKAYLALAQCPNAKVGNAVKALLENEPSHQVGGFIASHIRNVRSSANPDKELAKQHLGFINVPSRFPVDLRKWSYNGELSYSIDTLGLASSAEANVIYSQNSFLPRSTSMNLTAEVFGHTFNFLEIETRQENLDRLVEHYLGPKGLLRSSTVQELWDSKGKGIHKVVEKIKQRIEQSLRAKRDVSKAEIDTINKQIQIKTNELNSDLDLDLSVKAFGSEVLFLNINEDAKKWSLDSVIDRIVDGLSKGVDQIKKFEETLRSNLLFLDAEFAYPTSTGFPLRLGVEGASNVQIKAAGSIDIKNLFKKDSKNKLSLIPSANIEIAGRLTLDALVVENGLKVISTLHTATGGDLAVELFEGEKGLDIKFAIPLEKQDLISVNHDIVFHTRDLGAPEVNHPLKFAQNKDFSVCLDQLSPIIGLTFCGDINGPNLSGKQVPVLPFPLAGAGKVAITIERDDVSQYHYRQVAYTDSNKLGGEIVVETLGKNRDKKVSLHIEGFLLPEKWFKAVLISPIKTATLEGKVTTNNNEKSVSLKFLHDNNEYYARVGVAVQGNDAKATYKPLLEYKTPKDSSLQIPPFKVEGQVVAEHASGTSKYTFDNVKLVIPNQKTITINGNIGNEQETVFTDLTASDGQNSGSIKGRLQINQKLVKVNAEFKNTVNPQINVNIKGELAKLDDVRASLQVIHGNDLSSKTNTLSFNTFLKTKAGDNFLVETRTKLTYPLFGVDLKFDWKHTPKEIEQQLNVQYNQVKFGDSFDLEYQKKPDGLAYQLGLQVYGLENRLEAKAKRQVQGDSSQIENSVEVNGKKFEVSGKVKHHIKPQDIDIGADLTIKVPSHNSPIKDVSTLKWTPNEIDASHKISSGGTVYVDVFLKANKGGNANGNIKVNLKNHLVVNGQIKANKGNGNAEIVVELPEVKKSAKLDSTFTIHDPTYNLVINVYPVWNEDKNKKITLSTNSKVTEHSLDTKNIIDVFGDKVEVNAKGNRQGDIENGKVNGEVEVTLPNNHYVVAKVNQERKVENNVINGQFQGSVEHRENKNKAGQKLTLSGQVKNTNPGESIYDVTYKFTADDGNGKNLNGDLNYKRLPQGDNVQVEYAQKIYGSILKHPWETKLTSTRRGKTGNFEARTSWEPSDHLLVKGTYDVAGEGKSLTGELNVDFQAAKSPYLKSLTVFNSLAINAGGDRAIVKGETSVLAKNDKVLVDFKGNGELTVSDKDGRVKGTVKYGEVDPISIDAGFKRSEDKDKQHVQVDGAVKYGKNQNIKGDVDVVFDAKHETSIDAKLELPTDKYKNNRIQIHHKCSHDHTRHQAEAILTSDGKKWTLDADLLASETTPSIDLKAKCPEGKLSQIYAKITKSTDKSLAGEVKLISQRHDFLFEGSLDSDFENVDDFHIKVSANSPSLKLDKVVVEAVNKPAKTGRRIQITAKANNKNVVTGSTSYTSREEKGKLIVEGSGSFKVKEETKSANFKYIRQNLVQEKNGETGIEIAFDAGLGNQAIDAELKVTNKQFRILSSYCEEKKQCAHVEIDSKTNINDLNQYNNEIEIAVDLRKLGFSHEFGLKAVTNRKEWVMDHTVDVHFQSQENAKYQYSLYVHPKEAGVSLTTPKRIIAIEANVNVPRNVKEGGKVNGEIVFYLDKKNQPNQKTALIGWLNVDPKSNSVEGELKFTNPGLRRPLSISGNSRVTGNKRSVSSVLNLDIFNQPNQKIVITHTTKVPELKNSPQYDSSDVVEIKSAGLTIDIHAEQTVHLSPEAKSVKVTNGLKYQVGNSRYNSAFNWELSPSTVSVLVRILNIDLFQLQSKMQLSKNAQIVNTEVASYGSKPAVSHLEVKNWNTVKFSIARKDAPNDKLQINSGLIAGQIADFRADVTKGGAKHDLIHASVKLDEANFLKSDYGVQSKNIQDYVLTPFKNDLANHLKELKTVADTWARDADKEVKQIGELAKRASPNLAPLRDYYVSELKKLKEEIVSDKTIKNISEFLQNIFHALAQTFGEVFAQFSQVVESVVRAVTVSFEKVLQAIDRELLPKLKELADKLFHAAAQIFDRVADIVLTYLAKAAEIAEKYQPELKQLGATISEATEDLIKVIVKAYDSVRSVLLEQWTEIWNEIKALPIFEEFQAQYQTLLEGGFPSSEQFISTLRDVVSTIKDIAPFDEVKVLVETIGHYAELKLSNKKVDDVAELDKIAKAALAVVRRLVSLITEQGQPDWETLKIPSIPANFLNRLPRLAAIRFSPLSYLLKEHTPGVPEFLLSLINKPRNWVPPFPLYGLVAQGQHIFTFDGKHLTFPGNCKYVLAHDALDGNFTIVGSYANGQLAAITLAAGGDSVTLKKGGQVLTNNKPSELPTRRPDVAAFRNYERIELISRAGVHVICGPELVVCTVTISGFYHGKIRGLLGNGNNEPYDDFTIANGKIVTSESEFGNSFKVGGCAAVKAVEHAGHTPAPSCVKLFSWDSELRYCYPFVNSQNFKTACEHGVASGVKDTEHAIAVAYVAICNRHNIPIRVPEEYVQCTNGEKRSIDDKFSVKTPAKSADIVLLVDTVKSNEPVYKEYVQPLVQQVSNELHAKGINDVNFHLITYGGENQWPSHVTVGGKITFTGKAPDLKFTEEPKDDNKLVIGCKFWDPLLETSRSIAHDLKLAFGQDLQAQTYEEGFKYPFRPEALKSIIAVTSAPCEIGRFFPLQVLRTLFYRSKTINLNLITPIEDLTVKDAKNLKEIVGFNDHNVFLSTQGKGKKGQNSELHKELDYSDYCVDFTLENRGNVFVTNNFLAAKGAARKHFVQAASHNIVEQFVSVEQGLDCECKYVTPFTARSVCHVVQSKEKAGAKH